MRPSCLPMPVFDYTVTHTAPPALTADGAMDGLSHILEVFYGAVGKPYYDKITSDRRGRNLADRELPAQAQSQSSRHDAPARPCAWPPIWAAMRSCWAAPTAGISPASPWWTS